MKTRLVIFLCAYIVVSVALADEQTLTLQYQQKIFSVPLPTQTLWISKQSREDITNILARDFTDLQIHYWGEGNTTAWIFSKLGSENNPMTVGVTIVDNAVADVTVWSGLDDWSDDLVVDNFVGVTIKMLSSMSSTVGKTSYFSTFKQSVNLALYCHELTPFAEYQNSMSSDEPSP